MHVQTLVELRLRNLVAEMRSSGQYYAQGWAKALDGLADELAGDHEAVLEWLSGAGHDRAGCLK